MTYLTPEIEAFSNSSNNSSLVRPTISCGIFQDCDCNAEDKNSTINKYLNNSKDYNEI